MTKSAEQPPMSQAGKDVTTWLQHIKGCQHCALVLIEKPQTMVLCCVTGAPKLLDYLAGIAKPRREPEYRRVSKKQARAAMRYKE